MNGALSGWLVHVCDCSCVRGKGWGRGATCVLAGPLGGAEVRVACSGRFASHRHPFHQPRRHSCLPRSMRAGVLQPMDEIGRICREAGVFFHTDAAQVRVFGFRV